MRWLSGHRRDVRAVAFTPDGRVVSGGGDGTVRIWDPASGECVTTIKAGAPVYAVAASPVGGLLAYAGRPPARADLTTVSLCDLTGKLTARYGFRTERGTVEQVAGTWEFTTVTRTAARSVWSLAFSAEGRFLAAATRQPGAANIPSGCDGWVWEVSITAAAHRLPGDDVYAIAFAPAGTRLAVTRRQAVHVLDGPAADTGRTFPFPAEWSPAVAFVPWTERLVYVAGMTLYFADPGDPAKKPDRVKTGIRTVSALAASPDGRTLLAGGRPGTVQVYDVATRTRTTTYDFGIGGLHALAFAPDGLTFAAAGDQGLVVCDSPG